MLVDDVVVEADCLPRIVLLLINLPKQIGGVRVQRIAGLELISRHAKKPLGLRKIVLLPGAIALIIMSRALSGGGGVPLQCFIEHPTGPRDPPAGSQKPRPAAPRPAETFGRQPPPLR